MKLADIRIEYSLKSLDEKEVLSSPIDQLKLWIEEAHKAKLPEWNAMTLSTIRQDGKPNARVVLLKEVDNGLVFFTNYKSAKGKELELQPFAALTFFWPLLERQIRLMGKVEKISARESDEYFLSRPYGSQIGAWASPQSEVIPNREFLQENESVFSEKLSPQTIQRPDHWGGYRLIPEEVEFWQGRPSRLHDRVAYYYQPDGNWDIKRLAP